MSAKVAPSFISTFLGGIKTATELSSGNHLLCRLLLLWKQQIVRTHMLVSVLQMLSQLSKFLLKTIF
jgi:hypothetical protein